ncbi:MAG TPA: Spo0E family sporulation regulatory protein-aspartic acid phosphatase [Firmicutes bacterium]|nr:Spo0E family sporulation regulatory protein-aspartic acid phosphatase [Bacillota bacterium]
MPASPGESLAIGERLDTLKRGIEELRRLLHSSIEENGGRLDSARTRDISSRLDCLVIQYLRINERLQERAKPCRFQEAQGRDLDAIE